MRRLAQRSGGILAAVVFAAASVGCGSSGATKSSQAGTPNASQSTTSTSAPTTTIPAATSTSSLGQIGSITQTGNGTFSYSVQLGPILYGYKGQTPPSAVLSACGEGTADGTGTDAYVQGSADYSYNGTTPITITANAAPLQGTGFNQTTVSGTAISDVNGTWQCQTPTPGQMQPGQTANVSFWLDLGGVSSNAQPQLTPTELQTFSLNLGTSLAGQAGGSTKATGPHAFDCDDTGMLFPFRTGAFSYTTDSGTVSCSPSP